MHIQHFEVAIDLFDHERRPKTEQFFRLWRAIRLAIAIVMLRSRETLP